MTRLSIVSALIFTVAGITCGFAGSDFPDLKGTWVIETQSIRHHKTDEDNPSKHHDVKTGMTKFKITYVIDKQDGFRFSGTMESAKKKEKISGVIGFDNKTLYIADDDGMAFATLIGPDKMQHVYLHITKYDSVAGRGVMVRQK